MNNIQKAINRIVKASLLLMGGKPKYYSIYHEIEPSGSVEQAWKNVGKDIQAILDEIERKPN